MWIRFYFYTWLTSGLAIVHLYIQMLRHMNSKDESGLHAVWANPMGVIDSVVPTRSHRTTRKQVILSCSVGVLGSKWSPAAVAGGDREVSVSTLHSWVGL